MRRIHRPVATTLVSLAAALAVAAMMSAVPGAIIAVITAYLIIAFVRLYREEQEAM